MYTHGTHCTYTLHTHSIHTTYTHTHTAYKHCTHMRNAYIHVHTAQMQELHNTINTHCTHIMCTNTLHTDYICRHHAHTHTLCTNTHTAQTHRLHTHINTPRNTHNLKTSLEKWHEDLNDLWKYPGNSYSHLTWSGNIHNYIKYLLWIFEGVSAIQIPLSLLSKAENYTYWWVSLTQSNTYIE